MTDGARFWTTFTFNVAMFDLSPIWSTAQCSRVYTPKSSKVRLIFGVWYKEI
ncbi:hypothetical protein D3C85_1848140 [compost metagenome]